MKLSESFSLQWGFVWLNTIGLSLSLHSTPITWPPFTAMNECMDAIRFRFRFWYFIGLHKACVFHFVCATRYNIYTSSSSYAHAMMTSAAGEFVSAAAAAAAVGFARLLTSVKRKSSGRWWSGVSLTVRLSTVSLAATVSVILSRVGPRQCSVVMIGIGCSSGRGPQPVRHAQPNSRRNLAAVYKHHQ